MIANGGAVLQWTADSAFPIWSIDMKFTLSRQVYLLIFIPLISQIVFVAALAFLVDQANKEAALQAFFKEKIRLLEDLYSLPVNMRNAIAKHVEEGGNSGSAELSDYDAMRSKMRADLEKLKAMTKADAKQHALITKLDADVAEGLRIVDDFLGEMQTDKTDLVAKLTNLRLSINPVEIQNVATIRTFMDELKREEGARPNAEKSLSDHIMLLILIGIPAIVLTDIALAIWFNGGTARRLKIVMDNTAKLAMGKELNQPTKGSDEITELDEVFHTMAATLREAEQKERAMVDNAVDVICSLDEDGKFLRVSPASIAVWHLEPEELVGQRVVQLFPPEQRTAFVQKLQSLVASRSKSEFESTMILNDGTSKFILWSAQWSKAENALFCVAHDITERKRNEEALRESEARLTSIIETIPMGLLLMDLGGRIELANPMMRKLFQRHRTDELINSRITDLYTTPNADKQSLDERLQELFEKAMGRFQEVQAVRADQKNFPAEILVTNFGGPKSGRLLGIILDVTERHEIERFKNEFLGVVSHELRNPLTAIRGSLKMMAVGALGQQTEQAQKAIMIAERSATRLIGLVNDLLDAEKLEAGKLDMQFELRPLYPILEMSVESVKAFADDHNVTVHYEQTESNVYADDHRIVQVMINLLSNAIKYSPKGSTVRIDVISDGDMDEVRITDQGRGIPASHVNSLFQRFKQVERSDATTKGGTGLGLVICKAIIEQHMGTIGVDSEIGKGSTFWFRLPAYDPAGLDPKATNSKYLDQKVQVEIL